MQSNGADMHSEASFVDKLIADCNLERSQVKKLYTEFGPCLDGGHDFGCCTQIINDFLPDIPVYMSWRYINGKDTKTKIADLTSRNLFFGGTKKKRKRKR